MQVLTASKYNLIDDDYISETWNGIFQNLVLKNVKVYSKI